MGRGKVGEEVQGRRVLLGLELHACNPNYSDYVGRHGGLLANFERHFESLKIKNGLIRKRRLPPSLLI